LGVRSGCLLAARYARDRAAPLRCSILWQPVLDGGRMMDQFLRLRVAAQMMEDNKETVADLRARLVGGETIDVAGYGISPELARQTGDMKLVTLLTPKLGELHWFEVSRDIEAPLPMPVARTLDELSARGAPATMHRKAGAPFWASVEIQ